VYPVRWLVPDFSIRDAQLGWRPGGLTFEFRRTDRPLVARVNS
jgi:hypothetical protein